MNNPRECINVAYLDSREREVFRRLHLRDRPLDKQIILVRRLAPKERIYACGRCPSEGLCRFVNRYGFKEDRPKVI